MVETFRTSIEPLGPTAADRTVRVYLPPGHGDTDARYPVLYMLDGQNLFADADATFGRAWRLGEHLDTHGPALIVVGIDSAPGGWRRDEYTPWPVAAVHGGADAPAVGGADARAVGGAEAPRAGGHGHTLL